MLANRYWACGYSDGWANRKPEILSDYTQGMTDQYFAGYRCGIRRQSALEKTINEEGDNLPHLKS